MTAVAIGLVAAAVSLAVFAILDFGILISGSGYRLLHGISGVWYLFLAALAALWAALTIFMWRPLIPRITMALFSASMVSHILEQFVALPAQSLRVTAGCRLLVSLGVILLFLRYRSSTLRATNNSP